MNTDLRWRSTDPGQTLALGRTLGRLLRGGDLVALSGPLGSGKTQFVKGLAAGLNVPPGEPVASPTFVLVREYTGRLRLYHIDAYRLHTAGDLLALGFDEMSVDPGAVVAVEWADRVRPALPDQTWWIELSHCGGHVRAVTVQAPEPARGTALARAAGATADGPATWGRSRQGTHPPRRRNPG